MRSATLLALTGLTLLGAGCPPSTPSPACSSSVPCPSGQACASGTCQTLSQLSRNFAVLVVPPGSDLLPQEFLGVDPSEGPNDFTLDLPATFHATIPVPQTCTAAEALPLQMRIDRRPLLPITSGATTCGSDVLGTLSCVLPANEPIDVALTTALPCAAAGTQVDQVLLPGPLDPATFGLPPPSETLTIVGTLSVLDPDDGGIGALALAGASVTVLAAGGPAAGQPISTTVIAQPRNATCSSPVDPCSTVGFVIPVPLDRVLLDGGGCVPPTGSAACLLDSGCPFSPCATFVLEVGPSAADGGGTLTSIDFLVQRQVTPADPDIGSLAGPTLSLMGDGQFGIQLPVGPGTAVVEGFAFDPVNTLLSGARVDLRSVGSLDACLGQPLAVTDPKGITLCSYSTRTLTNQTFPAGHFSMQAPPGSFSLTISPPASQLDLAPHVSKVTVPADGGDTNPLLSNENLRPATLVSGRVLDPRTGRPLTGGQVRVLPINSEQLINSIPIDDHGNFVALSVPPTTSAGDVFLFQPPDGIGLAESNRILTVDAGPGTLDVGDQTVSVGVPISGAVFAKTLDGSRRPVASASVRFYLFYSGDSSDGGVPVAIPVANAVTDAVGRYSAVVPNVSPQ